MLGFVEIALFTAMGATVIALVVGLVHFFRDGDDARKKSNKMMRMRVIFQGVALAMFALLLVMRGG